MKASKSRKTYATRLSPYEAKIVEEIANQDWPECNGNLSELIRAIIVDWGRIKDQTGGKSNLIRKDIRDLNSSLVQEIREIKTLLESKDVQIHPRGN